eukprot:828859-Lingulodinium_polyedra.AAC.1
MDAIEAGHQVVNYTYATFMLRKTIPEKATPQMRATAATTLKAELKNANLHESFLKEIAGLMQE